MPLLVQHFVAAYGERFGALVAAVADAARKLDGALVAGDRIGGLERAAAMTKETLVVETALAAESVRQPVMRFFLGAEFGGDVLGEAAHLAVGGGRSG